MGVGSAVSAVKPNWNNGFYGIKKISNFFETPSLSVTPALALRSALIYLFLLDSHWCFYVIIRLRIFFNACGSG